MGSFLLGRVLLFFGGVHLLRRLDVLGGVLFDYRLISLGRGALVLIELAKFSKYFVIFDDFSFFPKAVKRVGGCFSDFFRSFGVGIDVPDRFDDVLHPADLLLYRFVEEGGFLFLARAIFLGGGAGRLGAADDAAGLEEPALRKVGREGFGSGDGGVVGLHPRDY